MHPLSLKEDLEDIDRYFKALTVKEREKYKDTTEDVVYLFVSTDLVFFKPFRSFGSSINISIENEKFKSLKFLIDRGGIFSTNIPINSYFKKTLEELIQKKSDKINTFIEMLSLAAKMGFMRDESTEFNEQLRKAIPFLKKETTIQIMKDLSQNENLLNEVIWQAITSNQQQIIDFAKNQNLTLRRNAFLNTFTTLHAALAYSNLNIINAITTGAEYAFIESKSILAGLNALHLSILLGRNDVFDHLLTLEWQGYSGKYGINLLEKDMVFNWTPLFMAVMMKNNHVVKALLDREDVRNNGLITTDLFGNTLLHAAAINGNDEIFQLLLDKGFKLDSKNKFGDTPFHISSAIGWDKISKIIEKNKDFNELKTITNNENKTAFDLKPEQEYPNAFFLLKFFTLINLIRDSFLKIRAGEGDVEVVKKIYFDIGPNLLNKDFIDKEIRTLVKTIQSQISIENLIKLLNQDKALDQSQVKSLLNELLPPCRPQVNRLLGPNAAKFIDFTNLLISSIFDVVSSMSVVDDRSHVAISSQLSFFKNIVSIIFRFLWNIRALVEPFSNFTRTSLISVPAKMIGSRSLLPLLDLVNIEKFIYNGFGINKLVVLYNQAISTQAIKRLCGLLPEVSKVEAKPVAVPEEESEFYDVLPEEYFKSQPVSEKPVPVVTPEVKKTESPPVKEIKQEPIVAKDSYETVKKAYMMFKKWGGRLSEGVKERAKAAFAKVIRFGLRVGESMNPVDD